MRQKIQLLILMLAVVSSMEVSAQLNPDNLTVYPDLEGSVINDVITDRMGIVWMATLNGLVSYDGYEYKHYYPDPNDSTTLGSILTYRLFEDRKGNIWISCMDLLSVYNPQTRSFKNYTFSQLTDFPAYSQPAITAITADSTGRIYFGVASFIGIFQNHSIVYKDENEEQLKRFDYSDSINIQNVFNATTDSRGNVWIVAVNGFFRIDPARNIHRDKWPQGTFPAKYRFNSLIEGDNKGLVWMTSPEALLSAWNPLKGTIQNWSMKNIFPDNPGLIVPNTMKIDPKGNIWIASSLGLIYFDRQKERFETFSNRQNQKPDRTPINCLNIDSFENIWMGTGSRGLLRYTSKPVLKSFVYNQNDKTSITNGWVSKIFRTANGSIWLFSSGSPDRSGLNELNPEKQSLKPFLFNSFLPGMDYYNAIGEQFPGELLIQTNTGFFLFNTVTKAVRSTKLDRVLNNRYLNNLKRDLAGNLWYCSDSGVYFDAGGKGKLRHLDLSKMSGTKITRNEVTNIFESKKHGLWLLTNDGLFLYNYYTGKVERHGFDKRKGDVFWSQDINSFYEDSDGIAWVGTWGGGLSRYIVETRKIKTYTTSDGLPSMSIQGILADWRNKALWLSTFEGISRFSIADEQFNNFSQEDGLQGRLYADGAYLKTSGGYMIFGGNNGITVFKPDDIARNSIAPKVFITDFKIGNTSMENGSGSFALNGTKTMNDIVLSYTQNNISIGFTGIHYGNPARNKFAYKLENYDNVWREVGNLRTAYYYGLPPGNYTFRVKAANSNGVWNETGAMLTFRIKPPWWKTWWSYAIYGLLILGTVLLIDRFQRKRLIEKERGMAKEKELKQAREIEKAYTELKATQTQLIQSEKMASLGELTAGIAHEIQNPLNFVNNFSEVSNELIDEMNGELDKGDITEAKAIAADIKQNLEKINHHGKRADAIVKGMLLHSRSNSGVKEPTDINALADEYLRLTYHGLRAKDKSFNATMKTDFDKTIGNINIIPQDIGRAILNLLTNAFYAVTEKTKLNIEGYEPVISLITKKLGDKVEIKVSDNGNGIPQKVLDKIFQPFYTTKPPGEGTGLGLSLSYDIITKGHGGELKVETLSAEAAAQAEKVETGTDFIIVLPV